MRKSSGNRFGKNGFCMSQIVAWKCDRTGKVFHEKSAYVDYLKNLARLNRRERKTLSISDLFKKCMEECSFIAEITDMFNLHADTFLVNAKLPLSVTTHSIQMWRANNNDVYALQFRYMHPYNFVIPCDTLLKDAPVQWSSMVGGMIATKEASIFSVKIVLSLDDFVCMREYQSQMKTINLLSAEY